MKQLLLVFIFCTFSFAPKAKEKSISLAGEWRFEIADANSQAFTRVLPGKIHLPGTIDDAEDSVSMDDTILLIYTKQS